jgi:glycosyltransferase involved in cell wall biosynthesis
VRIGLVIYGSLDQASGGYLYDRKLVEQLKNKGRDVEIISLAWRSYVRNIADNFSNSFIDRIKKLDLDLLLQDELNHPSLFLLNEKLRKQASFPIISIVHHLRSSEPHFGQLKAIYRLIERRYLNSVDGFVFNSFTTQQVVAKLLAEPKLNIVAQPGGDRLEPEISDAEIRSRAASTEPLRIVFLGNLIRRKAPHVLVEAVASLPAATVSFAGGDSAEPQYAADLKRLVARLNLAERVHFLGYLEEKQLAPLLRESHVLVLPSSYEGYGIAYLEGMSFGLPAIGTRAGAAGEIIAHGKDGFLIDVDSVAELTHYLRRLQEDRALLAEMGIAARKRYIEHPTWQISLASIDKFLSSYNSQNLDQ